MHFFKYVLLFGLLGTTYGFVTIYNNIIFNSPEKSESKTELQNELYDTTPLPANELLETKSKSTLRNIYEKAKSFVPRTSFFIPRMAYENGTLFYDWGFLHMSGSLKRLSTTQPSFGEQIMPTTPNPDNVYWNQPDSSLSDKPMSTTQKSTTSSFEQKEDFIPVTANQPSEEMFTFAQSSTEPVRGVSISTDIFEGKKGSTEQNIHDNQMQTKELLPALNNTQNSKESETKSYISNTISRTGKQSNDFEDSDPSATSTQNVDEYDDVVQYVFNHQGSVFDMDLVSTTKNINEQENYAKNLDEFELSSAPSIIATTETPADEPDNSTLESNDQIQEKSSDPVDQQNKDSILEKVVKYKNFWKAENFIGQKIGRPLFNYLMDHDMMR